MAIFAPPYSGKSTLMRKTWEHAENLFVTPPEFVVYCYKEWLLMFEEIETICKEFNFTSGSTKFRRNGTMGSGKTFYTGVG